MATARSSEAGTAAARIVFLGSGAFGAPVLERLADRGDVALVVSQPPRPAGRGREAQATPIAALARSRGIPLLECADAGAGADLARIRGVEAALFVVIAFGQKLSPALLADRFAINLHGSLLPRWRGAAPIQRAVMEGDEVVGVSVISLAERMDAGLVYATAETRVGESETAGELHDRLAGLGPDLVDRVLAGQREGTLRGEPQDESKATRARKLSRADAWVDFTAEARRVAARINGLSPWPGCDALIDGAPLRILRARVDSRREPGAARSEPPGSIGADGAVACGRGAVELLEVQSPGGRVMGFDEWRRGRRVGSGARVESGPASASPPA